MDSEPFDDPPSVLISATALRFLLKLATTDEYESAWDRAFDEAIEEAESALERYK